jgi:hypothetical protein
VNSYRADNDGVGKALSNLGGDFAIDYLNERLTPKASFRFVSNIVGRPHYLIQFTIGNDGRTKNVFLLPTV